MLRGLGLPGQVLVRSDAPSEQVRASLADNANVAEFMPDAYVFAQDLPQPNDPDYPSLTSLNNVGQFGSTPNADIDAPEAWEETTGSSAVVVGVIDSGIDVTHPDLYLNIWLNQGEIPAGFDRQQLDVDHDGRVTFYDLNDPANAAFVADTNNTGYIDAQDLLADPRWADGVDTDGNGFIDDFFGWNLRSAADEPFAPNDPRDALGHGTHVAGTIGAIGNNGRGVTGINWRTSLMALKFLDNANAGELSAAKAAVNYATMMRTREADPVNVRVLNSSWGQAGSSDAGLRTEIELAGQAGILVVAAAGNGNVLGQGINIDRDPFYPASYDLANVLAVAATDTNDELARFSNFGVTSVDLAAPGVGILSTLPGGRYGTANGTSMATPHVSGVAALIWSEIPEATLSEVRQAILDGAQPLPGLAGLTVTGRRLNARQALDSNAFAPRATLVSAPNITATGGVENLITVRYTDRHGMDLSSLGDDDLVVTRQWGPDEVLATTLVPDSVTVSGDATEVTATYQVAAPGGTWDALDYGRYLVSVADQRVTNTNGLSVPPSPLGEFSVRIDDPSIFYVNSFDDGVDANVGDGIAADLAGRTTLRSAIQEANAAAPAARMIILDAGNYQLQLPPVPDATVSFPTVAKGSTPLESPVPWSNETSGDLDVLGNITIIGDIPAATWIDAAWLDRVFKVYPDATLLLRRVGLWGGMPPAGQDGGGILTAGTLELDTTYVYSSLTSGAGGGVAIWGGTTRISRSMIAGNRANGQGGGGLFVCNQASLEVEASTIAWNSAPTGGGLLAAYGGATRVTNSTFSANNSDNSGAAVQQFPSNALDSMWALLDAVPSSSSADGRFTAFASDASNLVPGDTNWSTDVFVYDRQGGTIERISVAADGTQGNNGWSDSLSLSADGRFVAFASWASNLVPGDTNNAGDVFVYDRQGGTIERISVATDGTEGNRESDQVSLSADGRFVAFRSSASNLVPGDTNGKADMFVYDREGRTVERISVATDGTEGNGHSNGSALSADGRFVAFASDASNLVPGDTNGMMDMFVYDRQSRTVERVSVRADGTQGDSSSGWYDVSPSISADGRFVVFLSWASDLVPDDTNQMPDVFVYDRQNATIERIREAENSTRGVRMLDNVSLSADGRFVGFASEASNLVPGDTNGKADAFIYDRENRTVERVSVAADGTQGNGNSSPPKLSVDGRFVTFVSNASNLVPDDLNGISDAFVYDRQTGTVTCVTIAPDVSLIHLDNVTVVDNRGLSAVFGAVETHGSLYARNETVWSSAGIDVAPGSLSTAIARFRVGRRGWVHSKTTADPLGPMPCFRTVRRRMVAIPRTIPRRISVASRGHRMATAPTGHNRISERLKPSRPKSMAPYFAIWTATGSVDRTSRVWPIKSSTSMQTVMGATT